MGSTCAGANFEEDEELRQYLLQCPKYGNNNKRLMKPEKLLSELANGCRRKSTGNPFGQTGPTHQLTCYMDIGWVL